MDGWLILVYVSKRIQRNMGPPKYLADYHLSATVDYAYAATTSIPLTYEEALTSPNSENWKAPGISYSIRWELTKLPENRSATKGRWVYTIKQGKQPGKHTSKHDM